MLVPGDHIFIVEVCFQIVQCLLQLHVAINGPSLVQVLAQVWDLGLCRVRDLLFKQLMYAVLGRPWQDCFAIMCVTLPLFVTNLLVLHFMLPVKYSMHVLCLTHDDDDEHDADYELN